ncbi:MAG: hypothetical protein OHK0022_28110 [Roseiflexaceae bacterium]
MTITIRWNRKSKDYDLYAGEEYIGSAGSMAEALERRAEAEARRLSSTAQDARQ